jgi:hypothetical protein
MNIPARRAKLEAVRDTLVVAAAVVTIIGAVKRA